MVDFLYHSGFSYYVFKNEKIIMTTWTKQKLGDLLDKVVGGGLRLKVILNTGVEQFHGLALKI